MASFRPRFQIPGISSLKENGYQSQLFRASILTGSLLKRNVRSFFFRRSKEPPTQYGAGNCGKPLPICTDLVCKGCPSRCLEPPSKKTRESRKREEKSEEKSVEDQLTWWEKIFGPSPKRSWPDPCTCRLAYREKKRMSAKDPRLRDPRFQMTAGDVLLYTEPIKQCGRPCCLEPQPKSPPGYKMPKAALVNVISKKCDQPPIIRMCLSKESPECKNGKRLTSFRIPYEEMRPPQTRRKPFLCFEGVRPEDVLPPMNRDLNFCQNFRKQSNDSYNLIIDVKNTLKGQIKECEEEIDLNQILKKRSRVEQLKILVKQNDTAQCIPSFS